MSIAKGLMQGALASVGYELRRKSVVAPEATPDDIKILETCAPYTLTSPNRQWALLTAVRYIDQRAIPGAIVECGVWRGGSMMLAKLARKPGALSRAFYLFDTFSGMTEPTSADVAALSGARPDMADEEIVCAASREDVERNLATVGLTDAAILCQGPVEQTLRDPANLPEAIALLRLDTDWYESTKVELEVLYPRLAKGGVLIIDDYGHWEGARRAVDEYFAGEPPLLVAVDYTGRVAIKT